jgi:ABC-type glycerol-3-phosphate transport system substrate-binding protein
VGTTSRLNRRTFLRTSAIVATTAGCSRLSGNTSRGKKVVRWAQYITPESGAAAVANKKWLNTVVSTFEHENSGWKVDLEGYQWDQIDQRLIMDMRAGVSHDVSLTSPQLMAQHAAAGSLLDLSSHVQKWSHAEKADFDWSPVWKSGVVGAKQLGIPLGTDCRLFLYRKSLFQRAGLDPAAPPQDLPSLVTAAKKLTNSRTWGLGMFLGSDRASTELSFAPLVWHFGGDIYDTDTKQAALTSNASAQAAEWIYDAVHTSKIVPPFAYAPTATNDDVLLNDFIAGKTAASWSFGNYWISALEPKGLVHGCFPATAGCAAGDAQVALLPTAHHAAFSNAWTISIAANTKQADMAWKLVEVALRPGMLRLYADAGSPARLSEYSKPAYQSDFYKTWLQTAKDGRPMPPTSHYQELSDTCSASLQELLGGRRTDIKSVLKKYENAWNGKYGGK